MGAILIKEVEERTGKSGFSSVVAKALEEWLAAQKAADAWHSPR